MTYDADIPVPPKIPRTTAEKDTTRRLIVVLEQASLEIAKVGKGDAKEAKYHLLNCDDHQSILKRNRKELSEYRPDITHQCLLTLLDSPLNKAGLLQVFIHTAKNVLIEVNPQTRIPRTFARFSGLMVELLRKLSVRSVSASGPGEKLLNVIRNPVTDHLPTRCIRLGMSGDSTAVQLVPFFKKEYPHIADRKSAPLSVDNNDGEGDLETQQKQNESVVIFIGAMAHGKDEFSYAERFISVSNYPLSASVTCGKVCDAFEELWGVL